MGEMGASCEYDLLSVPPAEFPARIERILSAYDGLNVTIPYKESVIPHLNKTEGDARLCGAVNTVVCGEKVGYNTDGFGFGLLLRGAGIDMAGRRALVLGAGGAGRSCIKTLSDGGANVEVYEKDAARLERVREIGGFVPLSEIAEKPYDVVVNCTGVVNDAPIVRYAGRLAPVSAELLQGAVAVDLMYAETEFLRIAAACGAPAVRGDAMLFYQAYASDCIFLKRERKQEEAIALWERYRKEKL